MPYILSKDREELFQFTGRHPSNPGELNYLLTSVCDDYIRCNGFNYKGINDAIGALECAKLELYRRVAAPYEDTKKETNGDVYVNAVK